MTDAPRLPGRPTLPKVPDAPPKESYYKERLILAAAAMAQQTSSSQDRMKFLGIMDLVQNVKSLPLFRENGRADHPTRSAVIYAKMLWIIERLRGGVLPDVAPEINKALALVEAGAGVYLRGIDHDITGSPAEGYTLFFPKDGD